MTEEGRKVVQLVSAPDVAGDTYLWALCDDGSLWYAHAAYPGLHLAWTRVNTPATL